MCALNDTQFNSLADELQDQLPLVNLRMVMIYDAYYCAN